MAATLTVPTIFTAVDRMSATFDRMGNSSSSFHDKLKNTGKASGVASLAIIGALGVAANSAISFEDKMADIAKTTGLDGKPLEDYGNSLLGMAQKTRTSIDELQDIGIVGGTLGVPAEQLEAFTRSADLFAIALGSDFGGVDEAITQVSKIKNLFKDTRNLDVSEVITRAGSAINELSNKAGSASNINDFVLRLGALPDALKPSMTATAALGAFLEEAGVNSEVAASGFANFLGKAGDELPNFAKQMGISTEEAKNLFNTNPIAFATKFAKSLEGMSGTEVNDTFSALKINSMEVQKVIGALGSNMIGTEKSIESLGVTSAEAFKNGSSLAEEAAKKNSTTAAQLKISANNMQAFSIVLGTQLLPLITDAVQAVLPLVQSFAQWAGESPNLATNMLILAGVLGGVWASIKLISFWTAASSIAMGVYGAISGTASIAIGSNAVALNAYKIAQSAMTVGTYLASAAMTVFGIAMNLGLWPILAIIAAIGAIIAIFYYWDEIVAWFSSQWTMYTDMIGATWGMLTSWFEDFSFTDFFQNIGASIIDFLLAPLKSVLELVSMIPGKIGEAAGEGLNTLNNLSDFNLNSESGSALDSPAIANQKATNESIRTQRNTIDMNINDPGNNVGGVKSTGPLLIPIGISSTTSSKNW